MKLIQSGCVKVACVSLSWGLVLFPIEQHEENEHTLQKSVYMSQETATYCLS